MSTGVLAGKVAAKSAPKSLPEARSAPSLGHVRVTVDKGLCSGHARCWALAPDIFTIDEDGYSNIGEGREVPSGCEDDARRGVAGCPERALRIDE
jgi:ferredoxin